MKKITFVLILLLNLIISISCNEDISELSENSKMIIDNEEIPIFDNSTSKKMNKNEFSKSEPQITNDFKRESYLDTKNNQLKIPVIFTNEIQNKKGIQNKNEIKSEMEVPDVTIRIATRKSDCLDGIGFRCGNNLPQLKTANMKLNDNRTFSAKVSYDYKNGYVIYQFNQINWNEL